MAVRRARKQVTRRTQEARRAETRSKLLDAAIQLLCEKGYAGLTTGEVADRAALTRGAVQHHFGNADDICMALVDEFAKRLDTLPTAAGSVRNSNVAQRVHAAIDSYWESFRDPHYVAVVLVWFGFRTNKKLYRQLAIKMNLFERRLDREWQAIFRDTGLSRSQVAAARHIVVSALRGFAIRTVYRRQTDGWQTELSMLKQLIVSLYRQ